MKSWILFLVTILFGVHEVIAQEITLDTAASIAFVNVSVVSMQDEDVLRGQTVIIQGDRITSIGTVNSQPIPEGAMVIDGSGRYLIPGLADMHVHVDIPFANGPLFLNSGITTVLSLGSDSRADTVAQAWQNILDERESSRTQDYLGPTFYTVGRRVEGYASETPDVAERLVRESAEDGFVFFKIHGDLSADAFDRLHNTAKQLGVRVTGHGQRNRGMQPVYEHQQDLVHIEEYLYAAFNPRTPALWTAVFGSGLVLVLLSFTNVGWSIRAIWRRLRNREISDYQLRFSLVKKWIGIFTGMAWLLFIGLYLTVTDPLAGIFAGNMVAISLVWMQLLVVLSIGIVLTLRIRSAWREELQTFWSQASLLIALVLVWSFAACSGFLANRTWLTTENAMNRIAQETAAAKIWVTPNLVSLDYLKRQYTDEFFTLIQRPEMRYLRPSTRDQWIYQNEFRQLPEAMRPMQLAIWRRWTQLTSRLTLKLHEANVPLLAGSDAVAPDGVLPGPALHEELGLLVQAGLSPYEALLTATVNPAIYLEEEQEIGKLLEGYRADMVLLEQNPLQDIGNLSSRLGVMKRGRWFPADDLEEMLNQLAEARI